jgi:hypothetical protein
LKKLTGTLKITLHAGSNAERPCFSVIFVPYVGRLATTELKVYSHEDLGSLLVQLRIPEEEAKRWAGKARVEGVVLISRFERTDEQLRLGGLLA